jgi:hypothetical protein
MIQNSDANWTYQVAAAGSLPAHQRFIASVVVASYDRILKYGTAPASVTPAVNIANAC